MPNSWKLIFIILSSSLCAIVLASFSLFDSKLHLVVCDVGQGDGILIYKKTTQILIDGGPDQKIMKCLGEHVPFFDRKIDLVILTNPDKDHYQGLIDVLRDYDVGLFVWPGIRKGDESFFALEKEIEDRHVPNEIVVEGETLLVGDEGKLGSRGEKSAIELKMLWPTSDFLTQNKAFSLENITTAQNESKVLGEVDTKNVAVNQWSLVFLLSYGNFDALLTGDVQGYGTEGSSQYLTRPVEVLKVPHHGSKNGLDEKMLERASPELAIISDGKNNKFGHPHEEILKLLRDRDIKLLRTDQVGEVEVVTDGKNWQVK